MELANLNLPEFAFLAAHCHLGDQLEGRTVILHVRSARIIEIFDEGQEVYIDDSVLTLKFNYHTAAGLEYFTAALHYCPTLNKDLDRKMIKEQIMKPACEWYCNYVDWEDRNIIDDMLADN